MEENGHESTSKVNKATALALVIVIALAVIGVTTLVLWLANAPGISPG